MILTLAPLILIIALLLITDTGRKALTLIIAIIVLSPYFLFALVLYKAIYRHHYSYNWLNNRKLMSTTYPALTKEFELWLKENNIKYKFSNTFDIFAVKSKHSAIAIKLRWS